MGGTVMVEKQNKTKYASPPNFTEKREFRPQGVQETGLSFVGYEISDDKQAMNQFLHYDQLYTIRHGKNSPFFIGLLEGKIMGTRCPKCGTSWVPVRTHCWNLDCDLAETEWVEMPLNGKVHTWTVAGWSGKSSLKRLPIILVYGVIGGSSVAIANELHGVKPWEAEFGMPLKVVFKPKSERQGVITDFHFEPADGWKPSPMNPEKERIKQLVMPVYDWVKTLK
jgi:uncharacterized protein